MTTPFWTLLGPDFAGKSTILGRLRDEHGWHVVSHDDRFLLPRHPLLATLRNAWVDDALGGVGTRHTAEMALALMHPLILHQRDELARHTGTGPVIVDSSYYKVLAACTELGLVHEPLFDRWRSFPQPTGVVYLDVPPETTWQRSGRGARVSAFEHLGDTVTRDGFVELQSRMRTRMLAETAALPVTVVDGTEHPDAVLAKVLVATGERGC